jgi:hypothetical protein
VLDAAVLGATEEIKALKARYFRTMDTKNWAGFGAGFTTDATMDVSGELPGAAASDGIVCGRDAIVSFVRAAIDVVTTVHHGHMPEIEILSASRAHGVWAMEDRLWWPDGAPIRSMHGFGHYHETYERRDGRWLIASTRLTRLRVDLELAES